MSEKICENCSFWQPNGGVLNMGYCTANKWTYRKATQSCDKFEKANFYVFTFIDWSDGAELFGNERQIVVKGGTLLEAQDWFHRNFPKIGSFIVKSVEEI